LRIFSLPLFLILGNLNLSAQPFSSIEIGGALSRPSIQDESYSSRWALTDAYSIQLRVPYYRKLTIGAEYTYFIYKGKEEGYSDISATNYSALIGFNSFRNKRLNIFLGINVGIQRTLLLDKKFTSNPDESELLYSLVFEPQISFKRVVIFGSATYQKIYNYRRQHIFYIGYGVRLRIGLPNKIQEFIE
jgi:hypothetical protein|tara:strand:- start:7106 stop:7672 length:567 start_codon:yes stop_codon:yes gene_type:complete